MAGAKEEVGGNAEEDTELVKHKEYFVCHMSYLGTAQDDREERSGNIQYRTKNVE